MIDFEQMRIDAVSQWETLEKEDNVIYIGAASCGHAAGVVKVMDAIERYQIQRDRPIHKIEVGCFGMCRFEPMIYVQAHGNRPVIYGNLTPDSILDLLDEIFVNNSYPMENRLGALGEGFGSIPSISEHPMIKPQKRIILENVGQIDPTNIGHYIAKRGFSGLEKALNMQPQGVIDIMKSSGLRGRGGAGFPTGLKWQFARDATGERKYMICNADEGDPGAFMDRSVLEGDPFRVIEGMIIAGYAIGANYGYIYIRKEYPLAILRLHIAIRECEKFGILGKSIMGSRFDFRIEIMEGAGAFVCGEETAMIASIMGKRGMPQPRPPFPAQKGLWGFPTNINNVKTLATTPAILLNGPEWYNTTGTKGTKGTAVFALTGKLQNSGLVEIQMGMTLREIIFEIGGGMAEGKDFKAVQTGGPSGGCLPESALDYIVDFESLKEAGTIMGSGGMIVMDEDTCVVDVAHFFLSFTQEESCGKCSPCRIGTKQMLDILVKIKTGQAEHTDMIELSKLAWTVQNGSLCALGQTAPNPVLTTLRYFSDEFEEHIMEKKCRAKVCKQLIQYLIDRSKCIGCGVCQKRCPVSAISETDSTVTAVKGSDKRVRYIDPGICIRCGLCIETCPPKVSAISKTSPVKGAGISSEGGGAS
ncbi:MAG: 4Fe-4S dicluster domain-containing protein [Candidatus Thermoplasmatota archaeon]|nr:4Fe-4S dicluster domain-containing protein [Candidatus Thermoplasmatota archaeon]